MQDHDDGHGECDDVEKAGGALEYDGVAKLDISCEAVGVDADAVRDGGHGADRRTQRQRCRAADVTKVTEASHLVAADDGMRWCNKGDVRFGRLVVSGRRWSRSSSIIVSIR